MATQLANQLSGLRTAQTDLLIPKKRKVSILFAPEKAQTMTMDDFYEIGTRGLTELLEVNPKFSEFHTSLFDPRSKSSQRAFYSAEENKELDVVLERLLAMISPHINLGAAKKVLEWLLQRYNINDMNIHSFVFCILPYHSQAIFVRILSTINIKKEEKVWDWLLLYQKNGHTVPAKTIALHWATSTWFRNALAKYFSKFKKILDSSEVEIFAKFHSDTLIQGISICDKVTEKHVASVYQTLSKFMGDKFDRFTDMGLSQILALSEKAALAETCLTPILNTTSRILLKEDAPTEKIFFCLLWFSMQQKVKSLPKESVENFTKNDEFLDVLQKLAPRIAMAAFVTPLVQEWTRQAFSGSCEASIAEELMKILGFLKCSCFVPTDAQNIIGTFGATLLEFSPKLDIFKATPQLAQILCDLQVSHPDCLPEELSSFVKLDEQTMDLTEEPLGEDPSLMKVDLEGANEYKEWLERARSLDFKSTLEAGYQDEYSCDMTEATSLLWEASQALDNHVIRVKKHENISIAVVKDNLDCPKSRVTFLSLMWTITFRNERQDAYLKLWSARLARHMISTLYANAEDLTWVEEPEFLLSLLVPLCHGDLETRQEVLGIFDVVKRRSKTKGFMLFVNSILSLKEEISRDISFLVAAGKKLKSAPVMEALLGILEDKKVPFCLKSSLLYYLSGITDQEILEKSVATASKALECCDSCKELPQSASLCLYYTLMRLSSSSAEVFMNEGVRNVFFESLKRDAPSIIIHGDQFSPRDFVTKSTFLEKLSTSTKVDFGEILGTLISSMVVPTVHSKRRLWKQLRKVPIEASSLLEILNGFKLLESSANSVRETRRKSLKVKTTEDDESTKTQKWLQVEVISDLAETVKDLKSPHLLVVPLFDHLMALQKLEAPFSDLLLQKLHDSVYHLLQSSVASLQQTEIQECVKLNVSGLVHTIRLSHNPACKRKALMILTLMAQYFPDDVLASILPIFTFMGGSLMRRDDSHSVEILHEAIHSIVPVLLKTESQKPKTLLPKVSQVLQAFVNARHDIPEHRKFPLFTALGSLLVEHDHLWMLMPLVVDSLSVKSSGNQMRKEGRSLDCINFLLQVYSQFNVVSQLQSVLHVLHFVCSLPESYKEYTNLKPKQRDNRLLVIPLQDRSPKQLRSLKYNTAGVVFQLIASAKFNHELSRVLEEGSEESDNFIEVLKNSISKVIEYLEEVRIKIEKSEDKNPESFWSRVQKRFLEILRVCTSMLPPSMLLQVVSEFLGEKQMELRLCSLKMLVSKLQVTPPYFRAEDIESNEPLVTSLIKASFDESVSSEMRQWSLLSVQSLIKMLPEAMPRKSIRRVAKRATEVLQTRELEEIVQGQMLLTGCEALCYIKTSGISHLQPLLNYIMDLLNGAAHNYTNEQQAMLLVALKSLFNILCALPDFLSSRLSQIVTLLSLLASKMKQRNQNEISASAGAALKKVLSFPPDVLFPRLVEVHRSIKEERSYVFLMKELEEVFSTMSKDQINDSRDCLFTFFTACMDLRLQLDSLEHINEIEDCVFGALLKFMVKLDAKGFVSLYNEVQQRAMNEDQQGTRLITFMRFADHIGALLKKLFIIHGIADDTLEIASKLLKEIHVDSQPDKKLFDGDENKLDLLLSTVLQMVTTTLKCTDESTNPHKFEFLMEPLTDQLENTLGGQEKFQKRITERLAPCIVRFAMTSRDDLIWAELNKQILCRLRVIEQPMVILASLEVFESILESLGEDYVDPMMSDIMAYLTEVLDCSNPQVQKKTKQILSKMETIAGKSLQSYLE